MTSETKTWHSRPSVGKGMGHAEAHMHEDRSSKNHGFLADYTLIAVEGDPRVAFGINVQL